MQLALPGSRGVPVQQGKPPATVTVYMSLLHAVIFSDKCLRLVSFAAGTALFHLHVAYSFSHVY